MSSNSTSSTQINTTMGPVVSLISRMFFPSFPSNEDERTADGLQEGVLHTLDTVDDEDDEERTLANNTRGTATPFLPNESVQASRSNDDADNVESTRLEASTGAVTPSRDPRTSTNSPSSNNGLLSAAARRLQMLNESENVSMSTDEDDIRWDLNEQVVVESGNRPARSVARTSRTFFGEEETNLMSRTTAGTPNRTFFGEEEMDSLPAPRQVVLSTSRIVGTDEEDSL